MSISRGMDKEDVIRIYNGISLSHKKEWNTYICYNMAELWRHCAKWKKPDTKGHLLYDSSWMKHLLLLLSRFGRVVRPHRRKPTTPRPWDYPGKNTGVGCHFLFQCMKVKRESEVAQSWPTLSDPMDCSLPGSSIHGIFQARVIGKFREIETR